MQGAWNSSGKDSFLDWLQAANPRVDREKVGLLPPLPIFPHPFQDTLDFFRMPRIRNQEASVAKLKDSLAQFEAAFEAGRIGNRLQVDQARQALFGGKVDCLLPKRA